MARSWLAQAAGQLASGVDDVFNGFVLGRRYQGASHEDTIAVLTLIERFYNRADPDFDTALFPRAQPIRPEATRVRRLAAGGEVVDLSWQSAFEPLWSDSALDARLAQLARSEPEVVERLREIVSERYLAMRENRTAIARWYRHGDSPRPCAVLLHGYASGVLALEEQIWPVQRLYEGGLDVLLTVLPFHGSRRDRRRGLRPPAFPVGELRMSIEGMRQLVFDHQALFDHLQLGGAPAIGAMGMSFGGYSTALLATLDPRLAFAVLHVPLAHLEPRAWNIPPLAGSPETERERAALRRAQRVVSPFARTALVPSDRCVVTAGTLDRVTGMEHARPLATHLGAQLHEFEGAHLLQLGRTRAFEPVFRLLERSGLWSGRRLRW
jgi:pimeloyl-ACP methyl ester carboxylesterase